MIRADCVNRAGASSAQPGAFNPTVTVTAASDAPKYSTPETLDNGASPCRRARASRPRVVDDRRPIITATRSSRTATASPASPTKSRIRRFTRLGLLVLEEVAGVGDDLGPPAPPAARPGTASTIEHVDAPVVGTVEVQRGLRRRGEDGGGLGRRLSGGCSEKS